MAHLNGARSRGLVEKARAISSELRRRSTNAEQLLWTEIRDRRLDGWKFRRQHPLFHEFGGKQAFYVPDFYCHEAKLAIELDGPIHETKREMDSFRSEVINALGIEVIRFKNDEIDRNMNSVLMLIRKVLKSRL